MQLTRLPWLQLGPLFDRLPIRIYVKNAEGRFLVMNQACARELGLLSPEAGKGMNDFDFFERDLAKQWREQERRIIEEGGAIAEEIEEERHLDGRKTFVKTWKFPLHVLEAGQAGIIGFSMDVTTQLSQIHLDTQILDTVNCMIFVKEYNQERDLFVFSYVNQTVADYLAPGGTKAEMLGRSDADFVRDAGQVAEFRRYDLEVYQNKRKLEPTIEVITTLRGMRTLETVKVPIDGTNRPGYDAHRGAATGILGVSTDVTELKDVSGRLSEQEDLFRLLMKHVPAGIFFKLDDGSFYRVNDALANLVRSTPEAMIGRTDYHFFGEEYADEARAEEQEILRTKQGKKFIRRTTMVEGETTVREVSKHPIETSNGKAMIVGISHDITQLIQAEQEIIRKLDLLRHILDALPQNIFVKDLEGVYTLCNRAFARRHGYADAYEILGRTDDDLWSPEQARAFRAADREVIDIGKAKGPYLDYQTMPDGRRAVVEITKVPLVDPASGKPTRVLGVYDEFWDRAAYENKYYRKFTFAYISHMIRESVDSDRRSYLTLLGLTHFRGLRLNRAVIWQYVDLDHRLVGVNAIGQRSQADAEGVQGVHELERVGLIECIRNYDVDQVAFDAGLRNHAIGLVVDLVGRGQGSLATLIAQAIREDRPQARLHSSPDTCDELADFLRGVDAQECLLLVLPIAKTDRERPAYVLCCDNVRSRSPIASDGDLAGFVEYLEFVKKALEDSQALKAKREREAEDRVWKDAATSVLHDHRSAVNSAIEAAEKLRDCPDMDKATRSGIEACLQSLEPVKMLFEKLGQFSAAFKVEPNQTIEVGRLARLFFETIPPSRNVAFEGAVGLEARTVVVDLNRFRLIATQLWQNSVDVNGKDVPIVIAARLATPEEVRLYRLKSHGADWAVIQFSDRGPGVPDDYKESIFEGVRPGNRVGEGLGLRSIRVAVERHGGKIVECGKFGVEAVFAIFLKMGERLGGGE